MGMKIRIVLAVVFLLLAGVAYGVTQLLPTEPNTGSDPRCSGTARCFNGTVSRIVDGDTLDIAGQRIRLVLVDTPEIGEAGYEEATDFTAATCPVGSDALVDEDDGQTGGSFGRILAKVTCGGTNLNSALLGAGHAVVLTEFCNASEFSAEAWIRESC